MFIIGLLVGIAIVIFSMALSSTAEEENKEKNNFKF
jgi:hypothetical protein